jgi:thiol-disulfide isomerase/thioredoxin
MIYEIRTAADFNSFTQIEGLVVVHFWAKWNLPDAGVKEILKELAAELGEKVRFCSFDVDQPHLFDLLRSLPLSGVTAFAYFQNGKKIALEVRSGKKEELRNKINRLLNS